MGIAGPTLKATGGGDGEYSNATSARCCWPPSPFPLPLPSLSSPLPLPLPLALALPCAPLTASGVSIIDAFARRSCSHHSSSEGERLDRDVLPAGASDGEAPWSSYSSS